ncbi:MAG TPA: hypothetical protein VHM31_13140 [Polyangia bacterium]|nr:hypothetical protein [Polyangia bacterium]
MRWNSASLLPVVAAVAVMAAGRPARAAATPGCGALAVGADATVRDRWPDLPAAVRGTFETRADVDACARIELAAAGATIQLTVTLADGRTASRSVSRPGDVLPALEALLLLPEGAGTDPTAAADAAPPARRPDAAPIAPPAVARTAASPPPAESATPFRLEIAVAADARTGDGWYGAGGGVAALADLSHWLLGFEGRLDRYRRGTADTEAVGLELIALAGHRFSWGSSRTIDLTLGPALALHGTSAMTTENVAQTTTTRFVVSQPGNDDGVARLILGCRLTFRAQSLLRTFVQLDADVGQSGLPPWTVGLALGAAVGSR